jgi:hypothetical protein
MPGGGANIGGGRAAQAGWLISCPSMRASASGASGPERAGYGRGDLDGLCGWADAGDRYAASQLTGRGVGEDV